jgi:hypothetical protein
MARVKIRTTQVADLPPICVCCGEPATRMRQQEFQLNAAMSAAVMVTAAVLDALAWTSRSVTLALPVCEYHKRRGRQSNRTFFRGMAITVAFGVAAYLGSYLDGPAASYLSVAAMIAFVVTMVAGMQEVNDGLAIKSFKGDSFTLSGVNKKFAEAVKRREQARPDEGFVKLEVAKNYR